MSRGGDQVCAAHVAGFVRGLGGLGRARKAARRKGGASGAKGCGEERVPTRAPPVWFEVPRGSHRKSRNGRYAVRRGELHQATMRHVVARSHVAQREQHKARVAVRVVGAAAQRKDRCEATLDGLAAELAVESALSVTLLGEARSLGARLARPAGGRRVQLALEHPVVNHLAGDLLEQRQPVPRLQQPALLVRAHLGTLPHVPELV